MTKNLQTAQIGNRDCDKGQREDMIIYTHRDTLRGNQGNRKCMGKQDTAENNQDNKTSNVKLDKTQKTSSYQHNVK